eukprot:21685_4
MHLQQAQLEAFLYAITSFPTSRSPSKRLRRKSPQLTLLYTGNPRVGSGMQSVEGGLKKKAAEREFRFARTRCSGAMRSFS